MLCTPGCGSCGGPSVREGTDFLVMFIRDTRQNVIMPFQPLPRAPHGGDWRPVGSCLSQWKGDTGAPSQTKSGYQTPGRSSSSPAAGLSSQCYPSQGPCQPTWLLCRWRWYVTLPQSKSLGLLLVLCHLEMKFQLLTTCWETTRTRQRWQGSSQRGEGKCCVSIKIKIFHFKLDF